MELVPIRAAAREPDGRRETLRAWERADKIDLGERTPSGQRRDNLAGVRDLVPRKAVSGRG